MSGPASRPICLHCNASFRPDPRNQGRQKFCSQPDCRTASKRASQKAWRSAPANADYFKGPQHVDRVRQWRARNPGYWKTSPRPKPRSPEASPAPASSQPAENQTYPTPAPPVALQDPSTRALQDSWILQHPLFVGFVALQMGDALQEDIFRHCQFMAAKGREILRHVAGNSPPLHE